VPSVVGELHDHRSRRVTSDAGDGVGVPLRAAVSLERERSAAQAALRGAAVSGLQVSHAMPN
jgi:hypothetical protein